MDVRAGLLYVRCEMVDAEPHWIELHGHREVAAVTANLMAPGLTHSGPLPCFCAMGVPKLSARKGFTPSAEESGGGHIARPELELQVYDLGSTWRAEARGLPVLYDSMLREVDSKSHASKVLGI